MMLNLTAAAGGYPVGKCPMAFSVRSTFGALVVRYGKGDLVSVHIMYTYIFSIYSKTSSILSGFDCKSYFTPKEIIKCIQDNKKQRISCISH